jgi:hypothetical protein
MDLHRLTGMDRILSFQVVLGLLYTTLLLSDKVLSPSFEAIAMV